MFHRDSHGETSYEMACKKYGKKEVEKIVRYAFDNQEKYVAAKSLIHAATDEKVHIDGVYILVRRDLAIVFLPSLSPLSQKSDVLTTATTRRSEKEGSRMASTMIPRLQM